MKTEKVVLITLSHLLFLPVALVWADGHDLFRSPTGDFIQEQSLESAEQQMISQESKVKELQAPDLSDQTALSEVDPITNMINEALLTDPNLANLVDQLDDDSRAYVFSTAVRYIAWYLSERVSAAGEGEEGSSTYGWLHERMRIWISTLPTPKEEPGIGDKEISSASALDALARHVARRVILEISEHGKDQLNEALREASETSYREHLEAWNEAQKQAKAGHSRIASRRTLSEELFSVSSETNDLTSLIQRLSAVLSLAGTGPAAHPWLQWVNHTQKQQLLAEYQVLRQEILLMMEKPQPSALNNRLSNDPQERLLRLRSLFGKALQWRAEVLKGHKGQESMGLQGWIAPKL